MLPPVTRILPSLGSSQYVSSRQCIAAVSVENSSSRRRTSECRMLRAEERTKKKKSHRAGGLCSMSSSVSRGGSPPLENPPCSSESLWGERLIPIFDGMDVHQPPAAEQKNPGGGWTSKFNSNFGICLTFAATLWLWMSQLIEHISNIDGAGGRTPRSTGTDLLPTTTQAGDWPAKRCDDLFIGLCILSISQYACAVFGEIRTTSSFVRTRPCRTTRCPGSAEPQINHAAAVGATTTHGILARDMPSVQ